MPSIKTTVCVLTSRGMAAIGSVGIAGDGAKEILEKVFRSNNTANSNNPSPPLQGESFRILHGVIADGKRVIDEVLLGCEGKDYYVIHCHGNPLLVEQIVKLLQSQGAILTDAEFFAFSQHRAASDTLIEAEAKLAMQKSATLDGVRILQAQIDGGLSAWAGEILENCDSINTDTAKKQCSEILERSKVVKRIIEGVKIVIAGPPNSGKSTLLNCLAGQEQAISTNTAGTTRDWVSVTCNLGSIRAEFIDTAGLDDVLAGGDEVQTAAQTMTRTHLDSCDLVLYVQDVKTDTSYPSPVFKHCTAPMVYVLNKSDLVQENKNSKTQEYRPVYISAKNNEGIDDLISSVMEVLGVTVFDRSTPVIFTERQRRLMIEFLDTRLLSKDMFSQLLHGW